VKSEIKTGQSMWIMDASVIQGQEHWWTRLDVPGISEMASLHSHTVWFSCLDQRSSWAGTDSCMLSKFKAFIVAILPANSLVLSSTAAYQWPGVCCHCWGKACWDLET
jgi:hypothetical protein